MAATTEPTAARATEDAWPSLPLDVEVTIAALDPEGSGVGTGRASDRASHRASGRASGQSWEVGAGDGVGDFRVVRVPFTLPGEIVRARVWRNGPHGAEADLIEVLTPARDRRPAPCPLFGACAGCQIQHLGYEQQVAWKTNVVRVLSAGLDPPVEVEACVGSPRELGYRSKITPHHDRPRPGRDLTIGFLKVGRRHEVVDVERCLLATDGINARLPTLRAEIAAAAPTARRGATFLIRDAASGVTTDPDARVTERVGRLELAFFAREFFQNNPFLLPRLIEFVVESAARAGARVLVDAYSGSGLFALSAAHRFERVIGVEVSPGAVTAAAENAQRNGIGNARFVATDAARIFATLDVPGADAAVIIDPPRKGCSDDFLAQLAAFGPRTIVYVSCNPETMVRDLGILSQRAYRVARLQPFDMFPQTRHVECVAVVERAG